MASNAPSLSDIPMWALSRLLGSTYPTTLADDVSLGIGQAANGAMRGGLLYSSSISRVLLRSADAATGNSLGVRVKSGTAALGTRGAIELDGLALRPPAVDPTASVSMTLGSAPIILVQQLSAATANQDFVLTRGLAILNAWTVKSGATGGATDAIELRNGTTNVIGSVSLNTVTVGTVTMFGSLSPTYFALTAGATLRVAKTSGTNCACYLAILAIPTEL